MFDIGVNLSSTQFDHDRDDVVARAKAAGVTQMLLTGTNLRESERVVAMAQRYPGCWATVGVHPHDASSWSNDVESRLRHLASAPDVVAIGECGLDFDRNYSTPEEQERAFSAQLKLASELQLPVFMHCREAHSRFIALLDPWIERLPGGVLHCFTGNKDEAKACLDRGLYLGITGWVCDERRGLALREILPHIPADRLLLETDAPWLLPRTLLPRPKTRRNEPAFLAHIYEQVAHWRGEKLSVMHEQLEVNARRLFSRLNNR